MPENIDYAKIIKNKLNIADYIGKDVKLQKSGLNFKGLCPFHKEKTPSFIVNEAKENYKCFGCGKSGDIFSYVMEKYRIGFKESLDVLANEAGINITKYTSNLDTKLYSVEKKKKYHNIMDIITKYYHERLKTYLKSNNIKFLSEKKIDINTVNNYLLGLSSNAEKLIFFLESKGITSDSLVELGIIKINKLGKKYDMFTNRIMFPIKDSLDKVVGFGGRDLSNEGPKYINSWENDFFKKRYILYNMQNLKNLKSRADNLFIVEGYTDVIAMEKIGYKAVAPLGTSVSIDQVNIAWKYNNEPNILFDGDEAGIKATYRILDLCLPEIKDDKSLNFIFLDDKVDPDSLLQNNDGINKFKRLLDNKLSCMETLIKSEIKNNLDTPERILGLKKKLLYKVDSINDMDTRKMYKYIITQKIEQILREKVSYGKFSSLKINKDNYFINNYKNRKEEQFVLRRERSILGAMINNFKLLKENDEILAEFYISNQELATLRDMIIKIISQEKVDNSEVLKNLLIKKGFSNIIKKHFITEDCINFNLIENYSKEKTNLVEAKKALMNVILLQEKWYKRKNKALSNI